jgi:hypothetical protein
MDPIIYLTISHTQAQAMMQLAGERIQTLSYRLTQDHTTKSRSDLLCQIKLLTDLLAEVNHSVRRSDETKTT